MNCKEAGPLLVGYLEGSLDDDTFSDLNDHLSECKRCSNDLYELSVMESLARSVTPEFDEKKILNGIMSSIKNSALESAEEEKKKNGPDEKSNILDFDPNVRVELIPPVFQKGFFYRLNRYKTIVSIAAVFLILVLTPFIPVSQSPSDNEKMQELVIKKAVLKELKTYMVLNNFIEDFNDFDFAETKEEIPVEFLLGYNSNK